MKKRRYSVWFAVVMVMVSGMAWAQSTYVWQGTNSSALSTYLGTGSFDLSPYANANTATADGGSYNLWDLGGVPGSADTASFFWSSTNKDVWSVNSYEGDPVEQTFRSVVIDGGFDVSHLILTATAYNQPSRGTDARLDIDKDLSVEDVTLNFGYSSSGQGFGNLQILSSRTLTLTGSNPFSFGGSRGGWGGLTIEGTLRFDGSSQTLDAFNYASSTSGRGNVEFTNSTGTLTLADPGVSSSRNMYLGQQNDLFLDPGLTILNPTGTGSIQVASYADKNIITAIGGGALDNAGGLAIRMVRSNVNNYSTYLPEGTYQSFEFYNDLHYTRTISVRQTGNVSMTGGTVTPGDNSSVASVQTDYSIDLQNSRAMHTRYYLDDNDLTTARGVRLIALNPNAAGNAYSQLHVGTGTLDIGGDLILDAEGYLPGTLNGTSDGLDETRNVVLTADAGGTVIIRGDYINKVRSGTGSGLTQATMTLIGGVGDPNRFEVTADVGDAVVDGTSGIGTLNVGTALDSASIFLVNDFLNDNDASNLAKVKDGEVLLAAALNINQGSTLDLNGNGAKVTASLSIESDAWLDLNTGLGLSEDDLVMSFMGVGDQSGSWAGFQERVMDSSNSGYNFQPVYQSGDDVTYWQAVSVIPEPSSMLLVLMGMVAVLAVRIRRNRV